MIEIIVYRKECDWCYWWQDTASDDHRSCCFNGSVSDENKKQLDPFFDADRVFISGTGIPLVVLGWLFYFRMLGSGDIKLFCVLGGIMGPVHILWCIWYAFLTGGLLSLAILILCGGFSQRIQYLVKYIRTGERKAYYRNGTAWENIHFTVPVFMSVMLYAGGMY